MTNNVHFPEPWQTSALSIAILLTAANRYDHLILAASKGDRDNIAARNEFFLEVQALMHRLANFVELEAGDNWAALRSSGFELRRQQHRTTAHVTPLVPDLSMEDVAQQPQPPAT
jgi:hypothetical protein